MLEPGFLQLAEIFQNHFVPKATVFGETLALVLQIECARLLLAANKKYFNWAPKI